MSPPSSDDDGTVFPGAVKSQTTTAAADDDTHALPAGTRLNELELIEKIGEGGFSIVYVAWDHSLERQVALKEYMPSSLAARKGSMQISPRSERHRDTFEAGLKSFINEAKLLAHFDHPSLVKVYRFWEANGTAYMVMPYYRGVTLRDTVRGQDTAPTQAWLLELLEPLTVALEVIHADQCFHRDIAPDNVILLAPTGQPLLLDFGAARRVIGDRTQALTVILKPGYAPVEQYAEIPNMKQGPWTDVYALGAVVYWAITGETPPASVGRLLSDSYVPLAQRAAGRYNEWFLQAIDKALWVRPEQRTQTIAAFRRDLRLNLGPSQLDLSAHAVDDASRPTPDTGQVTVMPVAGQATTTAFALPFSNKQRWPLALGAALGLTVLVGTVVWFLNDGKSSSESAKSAQKITPTAAIKSATTPSNPTSWGVQLGNNVYIGRQSAASEAAALKTASAPPQLPTAPSEKTASGNPVVPTLTAATQPPKSPSQALAQLTAQRTPTPEVVAWVGGKLKIAGQEIPQNSIAKLSTNTLAAGKDALQMSVSTTHAGYVYIFGWQAGSDELQLLFPKPSAQPHRIDAGMHDLPRAAWGLPTLLAGTWRVMVVVTQEPRNLQTAGWKTRGRHLFRVFNPAIVDFKSADSALQTSSLGDPICAPGNTTCASGYGTDEFELSVTPEIPQPTAAREPTTAQRKPNIKSEAAPASRSNNTVNAAQNPECAKILQQLSLGEETEALMNKYKAIGCR
jgi:serine/threonine protein kinase